MRSGLQLKLAHQLTLVFGSMVVLSAVLAWVGWAQIKVIQHHFVGVVDKTVPTLNALAQVQETLLQLRIAELAHLTALTMPEKDREEIKANEATRAFDEAVARYLSVGSGKDNAQLIAQLNEKVRAFHGNRVTFFQMSYSSAGARTERAREARDFFNGEGLKAFADAQAATQQLQAHHVRQADAAKALGATALSSATQVLLVVGGAIVLLSVALATVLTRRVMRQLGGEPRDVVSIAQRIAAGDLYVTIPPKPAGDQSLMGVMGQMQAALRAMVEELRETQDRLVGAARVAGMAEIATNVLHNVGNVLNSINIAAGVMAKRLHRSKVTGLARAVGMLDQHADDLPRFLSADPKGRLLPAYLRELADTLQAENAAMAQELDTLARSVDHVKQVVAMQQSYAGAARAVEPTRVDELIDEALRMNATALARHHVEVQTKVTVATPLTMDRHRVIQILVNLISNAKHAVDKNAEGTARIAISAELVDQDGGPRLRIVVCDNGEGIAAENLTRIFAHGFTTRKSGHGFGLHSCVVAAQEMLGSLTVRSDGLGRGATFALELPVQLEEHAS